MQSLQALRLQQQTHTYRFRPERGHTLGETAALRDFGPA
jgi:hypothetical protein